MSYKNEFLAKFGSAKHIDKLINSNNDVTRLYVTQNSALSDEHLDKLVNDEHSNVRAAIARNPNLKDHHLDKLIVDNNWVRERIAFHPNLKDHHLSNLLNSEDDGIREMAAAHPNIKDHHIEQALSRPDEYNNVLISLAENPAVKSRHIDKILKRTTHINPNLQNAIAKNPNTTSEQLSELRGSPSRKVLMNIIYHPNSTKDHLVSLANDKLDFDVRVAAIHELKKRFPQ